MPRRRRVPALEGRSRRAVLEVYVDPPLRTYRLWDEESGTWLLSWSGAALSEERARDLLSFLDLEVVREHRDGRLPAHRTSAPRLRPQIATRLEREALERLESLFGPAALDV